MPNWKAQPDRPDMPAVIGNERLNGWQGGRSPYAEKPEPEPPNNEGKAFRRYDLTQPHKWPDLAGYEFGVFYDAHGSLYQYRAPGANDVWRSLAELQPDGPTVRDLEAG